ncbi:phosphodiester glycosidase family protein [Nocardioides xinjiangensis]|uniref:phosphodiester glycosidase family protein n=1 Tax=Nocardioides xinjiangensis TaxID=2817376 RepID=UPI001B311670|nr:phosphodiester glycosidase family protein [Nocardioides sp. SYSU D00514]
MPSSTRRLLTATPLTVVTAGVLVAGLALNVGAGPSAADAGDARGRSLAYDAQSGYRGRNQTSDGKPGVVVGPPVSARGRAAQVRNDVSYQIAPGVVLREWDQVDGRQPVGQVRMNLVTVDLDAANITFEELSPTYVTSRKKVSQLGGWNDALAAVNGDFFDIGNTDAPLGVTVNRERGILGGSREGWIPGVNSTLWFDDSGPHVGPLSLQYTIRQRRAWTVSGINHPRIPAGQIGVFTSDWHRTEGYRVTSGKKRAREVVLRNNRVVSNRPKLSSGRKIHKKERVLVGTGSAAGKLATLKRGKKITLSKRIEGGRPTVAISGDRPLLVNGVRTVINNTIAHPRTAVGIDADGRQLFILVVDGRSSASRGYTMVELADMMTALGAENAINLDGGGSSAMYSRTGTGEMGVVNEPSDGGERLVPNAFGVVYHAELPPVVPIVPTPTPVPPTTTPTP